MFSKKVEKPTFAEASKVFNSALQMFRTISENNSAELVELDARKAELETEQANVGKAIEALKVFEIK